MDINESTLLVANKALIKIGAKTLLTYNGTFNDGSPNAAIMNIIYSPTLQELIEEHPWSFCVNTITPSLLTLLTPLVDFGDGCINAYTVPSDFLSLYKINACAIIRFEMLKSPFVSSNTYAMLSNNAALMIKYVFLNTDPTTYTAKFIDALSSKLAYKACFKISEAAQYAESMLAAYEKDLASACAADDKGSSMDEPRQDQWLNARLAGVSAPGVGYGLNTGWF